MGLGEDWWHTRCATVPRRVLLLPHDKHGNVPGHDSRDKHDNVARCKSSARTSNTSHERWCGRIVFCIKHGFTDLCRHDANNATSAASDDHTSA
jgi:hypothetical protein